MQREADYRLEAHHQGQLIESLEPDRLVAAVANPLPRLRLSRPVRITLWAVRLFVLLTSALVGYTFIVLLMK